MNEQNQQRMLRIVVFTVLIIGVLGALWYLTQDGQSLGDDGIFQFLSDPIGPGDPGDPDGLTQ